MPFFLSWPQKSATRLKDISQIYVRLCELCYLKNGTSRHKKCSSIVKIFIRISVENVTDIWVKWTMSSQVILSILTSLLMASCPPTLALAVPCSPDGVLSCENVGCENGMLPCQKRATGCENGGTRLQSGQCLCPRPFYGDQCQKRLDISLILMKT